MPPSNRQRPPFRAEHLGSLPRPAALLEKRDAVEEGKATQQELTVEEDKGINELVRYQLDCGFHAVSDGELRRATFWYARLVFHTWRLQCEQTQRHTQS